MKYLLRVVWVLPVLILSVFVLQAQTTPSVFINEFHYDNSGGDVGEFIEIAAPADTDLGDYSLVLYNGNGGAPYDTISLSGTTADQCDGYGFIAFAATGMQNGSPDGIALVDPSGTAIQFLSCEGSIVAVGGAADGQTSTDVGVSESSSTDIGVSLQRTGAVAGDGVFAAPASETPNAPNIAQTCDVVPATPPVINEFVNDHTGSDTEAFVEIKGDPDTDYSAYTLLEIEGDSGGAGTIDFVLTLGTTDASGYFVDDEDAENGTVTWLLVAGFTGARGDDIDTDNDGELDNMPWTEIVDSVAVNDGGSSDHSYGNVTLDGNYDGFSSFEPGGASRIPDGVDNDYIFDWVRNDFSLAGIPGRTGSPQFGEALNTPGAPNVAVANNGTLATPLINEFSFSTTGTDIEYVEIIGDARSDYSGYTLIVIEGEGSGTGTIDDVVTFGITGNDGITVVEVAPNTFENGTQTAFLVEGFSGSLRDDLDTDNDGVLDSTPWTALVDSVAIDDGDGDITYSDVVLGENYDGLSRFAPGGASRIPDGVDTDTPGDWVRNDFNLAGIPNFAGTPEFGEAFNTPGRRNETVPPPPAPIEAFISDVQGDGISSPLEGAKVIIEGVVVGDFQNIDADDSRNLRGFYLQEENEDVDSNPATSEGIFVFDNFFGVDVNEGDVVRVTGLVAEFFGETQVTDVEAIEITGTGSVAAAEITLPVANVRLNSSGDYIADLEAYEGMLVSFPQQLTVTELFNLDRFGEFRVSEGGRLTQYTNTNTPSVNGYTAHLQNIASRNIMLDDGLTVQNPEPIIVPGGINLREDVFRMGDTMTGITGVVRYSRGSGGSGDETYRIMQPSAEYAVGNSRVELPDVTGDLRVASFNVLNFFTTLDQNGADCGPTAIGCRGADNQTEFDRQLDKTVTAILELDADILGLVEVENNPAASPAGDGIDPVLQTLVDTLNAAGTRTYAFVDAGIVSTDAIKVAFIYDTTTVDIADGTLPAILDDSLATEVGFDAPLFDGSSTNRAPLAVTFEDLSTGGRLTIVNNHFKSKGGNGSGADADQGDGAGAWNQRRTNAAAAIINWLTTDPTGSGDNDVMIIGDFNAYLEETPITTLESAYDNLLDLFVAAEGSEPYSFVFDGQLGALDGGFSTSVLTAQIDGVVEWHINADEADLLDYNLDFGRADDYFDSTIPERAADHDPLVVGLTLDAEANPVIAPIADQAVNETQTLYLDVTITDADGSGDALTVETSTGTIVRDGTSDVWKLEVPTVDGPADSTDVTITVSDDEDGTAQITFFLTVNNVAPTADLIRLETPANRPVFIGSGASVAFINSDDISPADEPPAADFIYSVDCGAGSEDAQQLTATSFDCVYTVTGTTGIVGTIEDKDSGSSNTNTVPLTVITTDQAISYIQGVIENELNLNRGLTRALTGKLENVRDRLDAGQVNTAFNNLDAFNNQVNALIVEGKLTNADGQRLLGLSSELLESIIFTYSG